MLIEDLDQKKEIDQKKKIPAVKKGFLSGTESRLYDEKGSSGDGQKEVVQLNFIDHSVLLPS